MIFLTITKTNFEIYCDATARSLADTSQHLGRATYLSIKLGYSQ